MINFLTLTLRNFLSYGNNTTIVDLHRPGTTLILGENLDNSTDGRSANGCGKTVLINALSFALYDKAISNISKEKLINNINRREMEVSIVFEKDNIFYKIYRARRMKAGAAGNYVKLFKRKGNANFNEDVSVEDNDDITPDSISNTNALIERIVGFPFDLFSRVVVFSASQVPFLELPSNHTTQANQRGIVEHLFGLTELSDKANKLKEHIKDTEHEIERLAIKLTQLEREHARHSQQIVNAKKRVIDWERTQAADIKTLNDTLAKISGIDFDNEEILQSKASELKAVRDELLRDVATTQRKLKRAESDIKKVTGELAHLKDEKCPFCLQQFADAESKMCEYENKLADRTVERDTLLKHLSDIEDEVAKTAIEYDEITKQITISNLQELLEIRNKSANTQLRIAEMENEVNPFIDPLEELEAVDMEELTYDEINALKTTLDHQQFLLKLLTKRDSFVRKTLLNKYLPFLNKRLQEYLTDLGLQHIVRFTTDLKAEISQFGNMLDFGNLSAGQRARVNLALSFAFRDVLQSLHSNINICLFDEVLDVGLDTVGVQKAAALLKSKARNENLSLYIISHRDELGQAFDNALIVQLDKRFSYIVEG